MKRFAPAPLFLIAAILLDRVAISTTQIAMGQSLRTFFLLLIGSVIAVCVVQRFTQNWDRANFIVVLIPIAFIMYRSLFRFLKVTFPRQADGLGIVLFIALGLLYILAISRKTWMSIHNPARMTTYFNLVFMALMILQIVRLRDDMYQALKTKTQPNSSSFAPLAKDIKLQSASPPDIYVIVLDGYARQDVLLNIYQYDNSGFINELEQRGFYVATDSHSNYVQTPYTMASFWNLDYLPTWDSSYEYAQYLYEPIQNNRVFHSLDEIGYTTVSFEQAVYYAEIKNSDIYLSNFAHLNNFEALLLVDSPLEPLSNIFDLRPPLYTYKTHRQRMLYQLDTLQDIAASVARPKIVYAHILAPHPPFVFSQNGDIRQPEQPFTLAEGTGYQGGLDEYLHGYPEQVKFINKEIIQSIDAILEQSTTPPIIILMGDHGPAALFKWNADAPGCLWERTSNLYAVLLPGRQHADDLYPSMTPVNTFRVIFNAYFGTDLPLLEDKTYLMYWYEPTLKLDITEKRDSLSGCTIPDN